MDADRLLEGLDADQRRAVTTPSTLVAVIAGAGSGKTRVLTRRVAHRIASGSALARHTLVLTFTREAAGELRRRLPPLGLRERVEAGTFHAVLLGLLRQRWNDRGRPVPPVVQDRHRLVRDLTGRRSVDDLVAEIDWAAARGVTPETYIGAARAGGRRPDDGLRAVAEVFDRYRTTKRERGVIDLDDVLTLAIDALEHDASFAEAIAWRYRHLLVDEAQDLNPLQHRIVELLRRGNDDLFLVGDPAQAIYGFNGADPALLTEVGERLDGVEIVRLPTNHRCSPQVLDIGVHVLVTAGVEPTATTAARPDGPAVTVIDCEDADDEAATVVARLARLDPGVIGRGQVAVLARTHAQLTVLREQLGRAGIAQRVRLDGPGSPLRAPIAEAARQGSPWRLRAWAHDLLETAPDLAGDDDVPARRVAAAVLDFLREQPLGDGAAFRSWLASADPFGVAGPGGVELLTFHAAKGREWHTVVVTGAETGLVPHRSATTAAAKAEEARLLYVALTRATESLIVTWAGRRGGYRRRRSPLLDGWEPVAGAVAPPPAAVRRDLPRPSTVDRAIEALTAWRARVAAAAGILPDQLCPDGSLRAIAERRPRSPEELDAATGMGLLTARRLHPGLVELLDDGASGTTDDAGRGPGGQTGPRSTTTGA